MNKLLNVAWREFTATVFTRGFAFGVCLPPMLMAVAFTLMPILMNKSAPRVEGHVAIIDRTPGAVVAPKLKDAFSATAVAQRRADQLQKGMDKAPLPDAAKQQAKDNMKIAGLAMGETNLTVRPLDPGTEPDSAKKDILAAEGREKDAAGSDPRLALVVVPADAVKAPADGSYGTFEFFVAPKLDIQVQDDIEREVGKAIVDARIESSGMQVDRIRAITKRPEAVAKAVTKEGERTTNDAAKMLIPGAFMFLLWISVFTSGQYLLTSTIEEKSSRVMEVLLSAVSPLQLMSGKILGQMCVGMVILIAYAGVGIGGLVFASMMHLLDPINLLYLAIYFMIAFALIASLMAAVGSAVSDIREAQSLMAPVMMVLIIPMMLWFPILRNPNSAFATVCAFLPPISPFIMVLRLAGSEKIPAWQIPVSIVIGIISVYIALWAAAKIFRIGVLMYGKPPNFKTLVKWVRMA